MELPSCRDLGGEEPADMGFCPVDYFVPTFIDQELIHTTDNEAFPPRSVSSERINNPTQDVLSPRSERHNYVNGNTGQACTDVFDYRPLTPITYYSFGFVAGCIWGDDSSWKVQYLDLSEADKGILKREERFGYVELIDDMRLKDAIDMYHFRSDGASEDTYRLRIKSRQTFDLYSGKRINPFE